MVSLSLTLFVIVAVALSEAQKVDDQVPCAGYHSYVHSDGKCHVCPNHKALIVTASGPECRYWVERCQMTAYVKGQLSLGFNPRDEGKDQFREITAADGTKYLTSISDQCGYKTLDAKKSASYKSMFESWEQRIADGKMKVCRGTGRTYDADLGVCIQDTTVDIGLAVDGVPLKRKEKRLMEAINNYRKKKKLPELIMSDSLTRVARANMNDVINTGGCEPYAGFRGAPYGPACGAKGQNQATARITDGEFKWSAVTYTQSGITGKHMFRLMKKVGLMEQTMRSTGITHFGVATAGDYSYVVYSSNGAPIRGCSTGGACKIF